LLNKGGFKRVREVNASLTLNFLISLLFIISFCSFNSDTFACYAENSYYLEIIHGNSQEKLLSVKVCPQDHFYLEYTNSRDLNQVIDVFIVGTDGEFYLVEERYPWYGVGQEYHTSKNISYEGQWVVVEVNQKYEKFPLRVAYTVEQFLKVNSKEYLLSCFAKRGEHIDIRISVKKRGG
jgi:hypothetical protein